MKERVFAQAALLAGELEEKQEELLRFFCGSFASSLAARLRDGITAEDCGEDFPAAAALYALAALKSVDETVQVQEFKAGDLTVKQGSGGEREAAVRRMEMQAERLMVPYVKDCFAFVGV